MGKPEHEQNSCWRCLLVCQECRALREEDAVFVRAPVIALLQTSAAVLSRGREEKRKVVCGSTFPERNFLPLSPSAGLHVLLPLSPGPAAPPPSFSHPLPLRRVMQSASNPSREALFDARYSLDAAGVCMCYCLEHLGCAQAPTT